ncbi:MAG TPA: hypothetical protein VIR56_14145 [Solimonas sp.]
MIRILQASAAVLVMTMTSSLALAAPATQLPAQAGTRGAHHYIYYPDKHLYFSPETQMWFWPDGDSWTSGGALPVPYQQYASGGYNIYLDVERPYEAQRDVDNGYRHHKWKPYHYRDDVRGDDRIPDPRRGRGAGK